MSDNPPGKPPVIEAPPAVNIEDFFDTPAAPTAPSPQPARPAQPATAAAQPPVQRPVAVPPPQAGVQPPAQPQTPPPSTGVVCNHCGHNQTSGSRLCDACGMRIDAAVFVSKTSEAEEKPRLPEGANTISLGDDENPWLLCRDCGTPNPLTAPSCRGCGMPLRKREML